MNLDRGKIERLVNNFRKGIEKARDNNVFVGLEPFSRFPNGCCGDTSDLLAQYLLENGIQTEYVSGTYRYDDFTNKYSHAWLEINETILIDITADQFINNSLFDAYNFRPCYIGFKTPFYDLFELDTRIKFNGIENLGEQSIFRLKNLYEIILKFI